MLANSRSRLLLSRLTGAAQRFFPPSLLDIVLSQNTLKSASSLWKGVPPRYDATNYTTGKSAVPGIGSSNALKSSSSSLPMAGTTAFCKDTAKIPHHLYCRLSAVPRQWFLKKVLVTSSIDPTVAAGSNRRQQPQGEWVPRAPILGRCVCVCLSLCARTACDLSAVCRSCFV